MKKVKYILYIIVGVLLTLIPSTTSALTEQSEVDVQFTFNPFLTMTLSSADIVIPNLAPGTTANSNTVNIVVNTNNVSGYNLSATVGNSTKNTRNLVHTNGTNIFSNIDVGSSATTLTADNTWGYSIDAGSHYSGLPIYSATNGAELKNTSAPAADDTTAFLIGAKAASSQVAGDYTNVINFVAVTNALPAHTIADGGNMQDISSVAEGGCPSTLTTGQAYTLTDSRDGESYKVAKLADGNCWLLDNLRLDLGSSTVLNNVTTSNTNVTDATALTRLKSGGGTTSDKYPTAKINNEAWTSSSQNYYSIPMTVSSGSGWTKDTTTTSYGSGSGKIGVYYNFCAASAGSYCYGNGTSAGTSSGNATEDICPKGWRMPTGGSSGEYKALYTAYSSNATNFKNALSTPLSGYFSSGSAYDQGSYGRFWSSKRDGDGSMYHLLVNSSDVYPLGYRNRNYGISVRCLLR